ncbi:MAG TPA: hypothetical protein VFY39_08580, partial [Gammaproteobacteria bacterium]|nr:hypothetical protein [Gammaproteobacteria bacterium]
MAAGACLAVSWRLPGATALSAALAALVPAPRLAARLGACYLATRPAEAAGAEVLCRLILPSAALRNAFMIAAPSRRIETLRRLVAADFEAGRTAEVGGW